MIGESDLSVATATIPLEFERTYRSGLAYYGPFGWSWDHAHNRYLRELADGSVAHWTGSLYEEMFTPSGAGFDSPRGVFQLLQRLPGPATEYVISAAGGDEWHYAQPPGWPLADRIPVIERRDRHGNSLSYSYDAAGHLTEVRDDDDRFLRFLYGQCGLLETIVDHAGRSIIYEHAPDIEQLVCVREPSTPSSSGIRREYQYDSPWLE